VPSPTQRLGSEIERQARDLLIARGLRCLEEHFQTRFGELDLVMLDTDTLVIVEVRHRRAGAIIGALESVSPTKQKRIVSATQGLLRRRPKLASLPIRFDVIAVDGDMEASGIQWIQDAFRPW